jgi:bifunctional UDP-N-acetylglucosamine pyrophosphorylase/glucosamine-1-phosphate N-acetyltransferase
MKLSIVILAAGQGKRMNSDLPKVLQPLAGKPLLKHVIDCARTLDAADIHVVYGHGADAVLTALRDEPVQWALQAEQLGTGHAVMQAASSVAAIPDDRQVLVLYGDVPLIRRETLMQLMAAAGEESVGLLTLMPEDPTGYGRVVRDSSGKVVRIVEQKDATTDELKINEANTGIMAMPAWHLRRWLGALSNDNAQGEYYLTDVIAAAVKDKVQVNALVAPTVAEVLGINDKVQLAEVEAAHRRHKAEALMRAGATVVDPARLDIRGEVTVGRDVYIDVNVVLAGEVTLGDRVRIGPNTCIENCRIGADTEIFQNCVLQQAVAGPNCRIGPFARLRPGAELAADVHVGNFVEVKKSRLGPGSKANHLSYIGDTQIGSGVNVGAGTITCNYDGVNKSLTQIGDGAFIGSGVMLVAPVSIGAHATIGAGSTITHDAPAGKLTLERSKQATVDHWKRPVKRPKA